MPVCAPGYLTSATVGDNYAQLGVLMRINARICASDGSAAQQRAAQSFGPALSPRHGYAFTHSFAPLSDLDILFGSCPASCTYVSPMQPVWFFSPSSAIAPFIKLNWFPTYRVLSLCSLSWTGSFSITLFTNTSKIVPLHRRDTRYPQL